MSEELTKITAAWNELDRLCKGERKFTMSIPVQPTDSDIVIGDALRFAQEAAAERDALRTKLKSKEIMIASRDEEITRSAEKCLALGETLNEIAMLVLSVWPMDSNLTYVDEAQGVRVVIDELKRRRTEAEHLNNQNVWLTKNNIALRAELDPLKADNARFLDRIAELTEQCNVFYAQAKGETPGADSLILQNAAVCKELAEVRAESEELKTRLTGNISSRRILSERIAKIDAELAQAKTERDALREALRFYAELEATSCAWYITSSNGKTGSAQTFSLIANWDYGAKARAALEEK